MARFEPGDTTKRPRAIRATKVKAYLTREQMELGMIDEASWRGNAKADQAAERAATASQCILAKLCSMYGARQKAWEGLPTSSYKSEKDKRPLGKKGGEVLTPLKIKQKESRLLTITLNMPLVKLMRSNHCR